MTYPSSSQINRWARSSWRQEPVQRVLLLLLLQSVDQLGRREEPHPQARPTRGEAESNRNMSLSSSVAPDQAAVRFLGDPLASRQLKDLRLGQVRHHTEIVGVEVFFDRKSGVLDPRGDRVGRTGGELQFGQPEQELGEGLIARGGIPRQFLELAAHRRQAQLPQLGLEQLDRDIGHRQVPF